MDKLLSSIVLISCITFACCFFPNYYGHFKNMESWENLDVNPGSPLFLTPLIKQNKIEEARSRAQVNFKEFMNVRSYSGYLTVNERYYSNLFFWFFPAQTDFKNAPVLLWLQGGPGASSLIGLFAENGPFEPVIGKGVKLRKYSWAKTHSILYIDNPVGTGYSFTDPDGYCKNETIVGEHLYEALQQFFTMFPELQKNSFYVSGESYAGKYVPAVSYTIFKKNPSAKLKINLQGLAIGNGFSDPINQVGYNKYLYQIGLIDANTRDVIENYEEEGVRYMRNKQWLKAFLLFDSLLDGDLFSETSLFKNITGFDNYYNYLVVKQNESELNYMMKYIQRNDVRAALHVGETPFWAENPLVEINLVRDVMQSVAPWIEELLNHYRVLIYNGQLDIIVAYPLTVNYLQKLDFKAAGQYKMETRYQWWVENELAGYFKQAGNLTEVLVRNAGHMVPRDQPKWAFDLISRFTRGKSYR